MTEPASPDREPQRDAATREPRSSLELKPVHALAGVLLAIPVIVPLLVGTYAKKDPELWGFPFFYWYQLMWVFIAAALAGIAYRLVVGAERRRRRDHGLAERGGDAAELVPTPDGADRRSAQPDGTDSDTGTGTDTDTDTGTGTDTDTDTGTDSDTDTEVGR